MKQVIQGDVFLQEIKEIPVDAKKSSDLVLAEGEVTGHKHILRGQTVQVFRDGEKAFVNAGEGTVLVHDEHKEIELPKGKYEVQIQREYSPTENRKVMD